MFKFKYTYPTEIIPAEAKFEPMNHWLLTSDVDEVYVHGTEVLRRPEGFRWAADFGGTVDSWTASLEILRVLPSGSRIVREAWANAHGYSWTKLYLVKA